MRQGYRTVSERIDESPPRLNAPARQKAEEIGLAYSLLTRFPVPRFELRTKADMSTAFWAYPIAGATVGLVGGAVFAGLSATGLSPLTSIVASLAAMALSTGGFHEDGLADFWDGLGGGQTREKKLEIMRDSRIGTYGLLALVFALALQATLYADLSHSIGALEVSGVIVAIAAIARVMIAIPLWSLTPARKEGVSVAAERPPVLSVIAAALIAAAISIPLVGLIGTLALVAGGAVGAGLTTWLSGRYLAGYTGDALGASALTSMVTSLLAFAIYASAAAGGSVQ